MVGFYPKIIEKSELQRGFVPNFKRVSDSKKASHKSVIP